MWKVTLRQNLSRLLLSAAAVVLGVAFVAGTLLFSDGLTGSLSSRVGSLDRGVSVDVSGVPADDARVDRVRGVDGVLTAEALRTVTGVGLARPDGKKISGTHLAVTVPRDPALRSYDLVGGRLPDAPGEAVLDAETAREHDIRTGGTVRVGGRTAATPFRVVGVVEVSGSSIDIGTAVVGLTLADARALTDESGRDRIVVAARPGVSDTDLAARVRAVTDGTVRTRAQLVEANLDRALGDVSQFRAGLLAFALVSVLVAAFVIANTFTIVLTQRSRESAMLRMLGASRRQVFANVLLESTAVGLLASVAGLLLGYGIAAGIGALHGTFAGGPSVAPRFSVLSALVPVLTGTVVTVGAALLPAWRASRVPPVQALSDAALHTGRGARRGRLLVGALVLAGGIGILTLRGELVVVVAGGALTFLGLVMFGPVLVPAMIRAAGWPLARVLRLVGLAVADAGRNPRRVASTAMALVIGIGLVSAFAVGASSVREGAGRAVDARFGAAFVLSTYGGQVPPQLVERLRAEPDLGTVALHYFAFDEALDADITTADPALLARAQQLASGDIRALAPGSAVVRNLRGTRPGGTVTVGGRELRVVAVLPQTPGRAEVFVTEPDFTALHPGVRADQAEVEPAAGVSATTARRTLDAILADYPAIDLQDHAAFKAAQSRQINRALGLVTALLALAVVISLIGVANTLTLSVIERTREHALLRALGLTTRQLRWLLAVEAMLIALTGAVLGVGLGIGVIASAMTALSASNAGTATFHLVLPWTQLALTLAGATVAALLASVLPARRAMKRQIVPSLTG
ncbi:ABC transporter permease [Virgisporangium ochraceum]|uniref:Membrane protein n=1 Tax=Virgisporangium ochraceum TaxID=65505 RepID=A0A8J4A3D1_9ACTN|nr:FtsX-like permease family protein [Virgisporangium ochraceum]GIJ74989.1 membrane protein [Virgisporangium ochraceum]